MKVEFGPIVSDARGRFGGVVGTAWKGIGVMRRFTAPANPSTADQVEVRNIFRNLTVAWTKQTTQLRAAWVTFAVGKAFTGRNSWVGKNIPTLQGAADLALLVATPGDASTLAPSSIDSVTPGVGTLTVAVTAPTVPAGWTLQAVVVASTRTGDWGTYPLAADQTQWHEAEDTTSPYSITVTGLLTGYVHYVYAFIRWLAPDSAVRYSAALTDSGTPS